VAGGPAGGLLAEAPAAGVGVSTLAEFVRHAELYGTDCVYETASGGYRLNLTELKIELDRLEAMRKSGRFTVGKTRRRDQQAEGASPGWKRGGLVPKSASQTRMVGRQNLSRNRNPVSESHRTGKGRRVGACVITARILWSTWENAHGLGAGAVIAVLRGLRARKESR
jgi:hypothetical protein